MVQSPCSVVLSIARRATDRVYVVVCSARCPIKGHCRSGGFSGTALMNVVALADAGDLIQLGELTWQCRCRVGLSGDVAAEDRREEQRGVVVAEDLLIEPRWMLTYHPTAGGAEVTSLMVVVTVAVACGVGVEVGQWVQHRALGAARPGVDVRGVGAAR